MEPGVGVSPNIPLLTAGLVMAVLVLASFLTVFTATSLIIIFILTFYMVIIFL